MLQKLNERIQGVVAWLVVILIAITFTLFGVDYYMQSRQTNNSKVVINDLPISNQTFEINYRRSRAQQEQAPNTAEAEKNLQNQVLDQMITNEVTVQAARHFGFEVTANQANAAILQIPQFQEDGHFSAQRYQQALNGAMFTPDTFQKEVRQGMLLNQQRFAFMASSFALPDEIKRFVRLYMQTRDYEYLTISPANFEKQVKISNDQINQYYQSHQNDYMTPEQVSLDYVVLSTHDIKNTVKVSNEDIKHYYDENQANYLTPAQWQVAHILFAVPANATESDIEKIKKKADVAYSDFVKDPAKFDGAIATMSDDKLSLVDKGVLPWITAGQNDYDKILANLNKPGQISQPEKTKHGFEIFKLIAYKPVVNKPLSDVENTIKEQLLAEKAQAKYASAAEQLSDLSYQTPDSLEPVAKALNLKIQTTEPFSKQGGQTPITQNKLVVNTAFNHDILALSNNSEPLQLDNDSVAVIRVNKHLAAKKQSIEEVHDKIEKVLTQLASQKMAKELGALLLNSVEDKKQLELLATNHLEWHPVINAARDYDKDNSLINDTAFNLSRPESRDGVSLENGDYVVVRLKQILDGKLSALDKEQQDSLVQQIEASYGMMDYDLYVNQLKKQAKIEKH